MYNEESTSIVTLDHVGYRLLLNEHGHEIARQAISNDRLLSYDITISAGDAEFFFNYHREREELQGIKSPFPYLSFNYRSLFHALNHLYESGSALRRYSDLYDISTSQLSVGDEIQHGIDTAISGNSIGACAICEESAYHETTQGWQVSIPLSPEHRRIHRRHGMDSIALNPICDQHDDIEFRGRR